MQLKHMKTLVQAQDGINRVMGICWAPNNAKLAVCMSDRIIHLFDENFDRRDKFPTKPANQGGKKTYVIKAMAFSPDSTKIAVAQSDCIVYVYKIGEQWGDKKSICNKFAQSCGVFCMAWLSEGPIVIGLEDGTVRAAHIKANKAQTLYTTGSLVVSLASNVSGTGFISGHGDGSLVRYWVREEGASGEGQGRLATHSCAPAALAWPGVVACAGADRRVAIYDRHGRLLRQFDFPMDKEFTAGAVSPGGQAFAMASYDRIRVFSWSPGKLSWEETLCKEIPKLYTIGNLAWRRDGAALACSGLGGSVELFQPLLKRLMWKNKFELTFVGPSQVVVKRVDGGPSTDVVVTSESGNEIDDIRIVGDDGFILARTPNTLILGDLEKKLVSEIPWTDCGRQEKFYFDNPNVCLIFNAGELTLVEYGDNKILGSVRTEFMNPHLISVRLNERKQLNSTEDNKKLAYLLDRKTICLVDLVFGMPIMQVAHDSKVDWLELNETSHKLLFRDKKMCLTLLDTRTAHRHQILNYCTYVQWVSGSDVVVAQTRDTACVWYNIDTPDRVNMFPIRGEIVDVLRSNNKTEIICQEGTQQLGYELDESLVEFGTAIHDSDFGRAIMFLEALESSGHPDTEAMWQNLAEIVLSLNYLPIALRCYAALGDMPKTHYLQQTLALSGKDGDKSWEVWARMAILNKDLKTAESIYLENNQLEKALDMYRQLYKWEEAVELAEATGYKGDVRGEYISWLIGSEQYERAGRLKEESGNHKEAITMYLDHKLASAAARLILSRRELQNDESLVTKVLECLEEAGLHQQAGQLYEAAGQSQKAISSYRKAASFAIALHLARQASPHEVLQLEEEWGDHLSSCNQLDAAINHYIEAGKTIKALEAALGARQWKKAVQIVNVINDAESLSSYYSQLGKHFASIKDYSMAEKLFIKAQLYSDCMKMYLEAGYWEKASEVGTSHLEKNEASEILMKEGETQESLGNYDGAEELYILAGNPDTAIAMYKSLAQYTQMMRLVEKYHPDLVSTTHLHLGQQLEASNNLQHAEYHYIAAGEWKLAVKMLRANNMWQQAYTVALKEGGEQAGQQIAFLWAKSVSPESAVKLLNKFGLLEQCIDYACDSYQFEFGFELAKSGMKKKLADVHYKYAMTLEDDGKFQQAEQHFVRANKPREAVLMYIHCKDWEAAERVAESCQDQEVMQQVLVAQAKYEFSQKNYPKFESLLLRAHKAEVIVQYYQESGMWMEAVRVARDYAPTRLAAVEAAYEREVGSRGARDAASLLGEAAHWELSGQYLTAVHTYLKINHNNCSDPTTVVKALNEASRITSTFLDPEEASQIIKVLVNRLVEMKEHNSAAQMLLGMDMVKEAIDILIEAQEWAKATKIAQQLDPKLEIYVEARYRSEGGAAETDVVSSLDTLCHQGQFQRAITLASQSNPLLIYKYTALYATHLIKSGASVKAVEVFREHGVPPLPQNYNIYRRIASDVLSLPRDTDYSIWANLRDMFYQLVEELGSDASAKEEFGLTLEAAHYTALRSAASGVPTLAPLSTKISVALLRYTTIIPADKAFFEAGTDAKELGRTSEGFVFLNHCLDAVECVEEGGGGPLDHSSLDSTDFPSDVYLPPSVTLSEADVDSVRQWVLSISMDQNIDARLPTDSRGVYGCSLLGGGERYQPCVVTGWPVLPAQPSRHRSTSHVNFTPSGRQANSHDWTSLNIAVRMNPTQTNLSDCLSFISKWAGTAPNVAYG